jgi:carbamoyltransferase
MSETVLGISAGFHDAGVALVNHGDIVFASHSERYSGKKHDSNLNHFMIQDAVKRIDNRAEVIAYYERPWVRYAREVRAGIKVKPTKEDLSIKSILPDYLQKVPRKYFSHHLSHAASAFQTSNFDTATCIVVDAIGEFDTISIWNAAYDSHGVAKYKKIWGRTYPDSIGLMYSAFTQRVGLKPMDDEYILMGMAAYGDPKHEFEIYQRLIGNNLHFKENLHVGLPQDMLPHSDEFDMAAAAQMITEKLLLDVFITALDKGHSKNICYSGGVALNCVANSFLSNIVEHFWIMPNPGDAGAALGAAALAYGKRLNWEHPYLGYDINPYTGYPVDQILYELHENKIVGVAHGRAEYGPRALGNRSLLADPRGPEIKDEVNKIKQRQEFRPFAPIILEEDVHNYFEMPPHRAKSPYLQFTGICKYPDDFPAIIHKDGTSRVQTVTALEHRGLYRLLKEWKKQTGCPMLLNTSLNIRGKPMVNTMDDGFKFQNKYGVKVIN